MTRPGPRPDVSVVVPTHHRPDHLDRCLRALEAQVDPPLEVIVVRGADDEAAAAVIAAHGGTVVEVALPPSTVVERLHAGAARARGAVVAFTDDDAEPHPDWVARLRAHLVDPTVGAVGGRDVQPGAPRPTAERVGRIGLGGRLVADHNLGTGPARDVDHLRGVNMAVRRDLLRLPVGLRGPGAPGYHELATCLAVLDAGRRVVYDPLVLVDHHIAPRHDHGDGDRHDVPARRRADDAFNQTYALLSLGSGGRLARMAYVVVVGDRSTGGLLRCAWAAVTGDRRLAAQLVPLLRAQRDAWATSRRRPMHMVGPDEPFPVATP